MKNIFHNTVFLLRKWALKKPFIKRIYKFGSRAKGDFNENSDLDIAIDLETFDGDTDSIATFIHKANNLQEEL